MLQRKGRRIIKKYGYFSGEFDEFPSVTGRGPLIWAMRILLFASIERPSFLTRKGWRRAARACRQPSSGEADYAAGGVDTAPNPADAISSLIFGSSSFDQGVELRDLGVDPGGQVGEDFGGTSVGR